MLSHTVGLFDKTGLEKELSLKAPVDKARSFLVRLGD